MAWKLLDERTGAPVKVGDTVVDFRGGSSVVDAGIGAAPKHGGSTGRIYVTERDGHREYFPSVFGKVWVDVHDVGLTDCDVCGWAAEETSGERA